MDEKQRLKNADKAREFILSAKSELENKVQTSDDNTYREKLKDKINTLNYLEDLVIEELREIFS